VKKSIQTPTKQAKTQTSVKQAKIQTPVKASDKRIQTPKRSAKKTGNKRKNMSDEEMTEEETEEEQGVVMHAHSESPTRVLPQRKARGLVRSKSMIDVDTESEGADWDAMGMVKFGEHDDDGEGMQRENKKVKRENVKMVMESEDSEVSDWGAGI
jgi:hypothetical protein